MKAYKKIIGSLYLVLLVLPVTGQVDCQVLKAEISLEYDGECKNGLAHGVGIASGQDQYSGRFRKGYPHGIGTYTWSTGEVYEGAWKNGLRHGYGKYTSSKDGKETLQEGNWLKDKFMGRSGSNTIKVKTKRNVIRYTAIRKSDGNQVMVKILMNGVPNIEIEDLMFIGDSGSEIGYSQYIGYENVEFPFSGKITYLTWNKLKTIRYEVVFEFVVPQPGYWELSLHN